jgi:hypothetical protein
VSAFDTLENQLRDSARRRPGRRRAARLVPLVALAAVAVFLLARGPNASDEREAVAPASTWAPTLDTSLTRSPVPAEQLATYGVLRRPQNAGDRSPAVERMISRIEDSMALGVRVDSVRRLYHQNGRNVVLVSVEVLRMDPRDPRDDVRDGLCLMTGSDNGSSGATCGSFADARSGRMRYPMPPRGLAPDGTKRVTIRVKGGRTISITPRDNYYDASWIGEGGAVGIARPRFIR